MSKTDSFPAPLTRSNPQYILTKELQRLRRFGVSDLAFRPRQYPRLSALRAAAGQQPTQTMEVLAECQALFRAAFDMFPTVNLRQAAAILFHLDSDATPPPLADRRRFADKTYAGCNTARHDETIRRTLERDIDRLMLEFLPLVSLHCRTAIQASPEDCVDDARGCVDYAIKDEQGTGAKPTTRESATNRRDALKALGAIAATATAPRAWQQPLLDAWDATGDALEDLLRAVREPTLGYRHLESKVPSRTLAPAVREHYALARSVVSNSDSAQGYAALSEIAGLSAWLSWDIADTAAARALYVESVRWAEGTGDPLLISYMMGSLGQFAVDTGDTKHGLDLLDRARTRMDTSAPHTAIAWIESLRAVALADLAEKDATHRALSLAESCAAQSGDPSWPFVFAFDCAKAARWRAMALSRLGDHRAALQLFAETDLQPCAPKQRSLSLVQQARSWALLGDLDRACTLAEDALGAGRHYRSERAIGQVRAFRRSLPQDAGSAAKLDEQLSDLYGRDALI